MLHSFFEGIVVGFVAALLCWLVLRVFEVISCDNLRLEDDWGTWKVEYRDEDKRNRESS